MLKNSTEVKAGKTLQITVELLNGGILPEQGITT